MARRLSHAQRHFIRVTASLAAAAAPDVHGGMAHSSTYELMLSKLTQDRVRLKQIQSVEQKIEIKRQILPEYADYVIGVLEGGTGAQDEVLTRVMVWLIDVGDIAGALLIADYVLRHNLALPDKFRRTLGCMIAEEVAEHAASQLLAVAEPVRLDLLARTQELVAGQDMPDEVRAKLEKVIARTMLLEVNPDDPSSTDKTWLEQARAHFQRALELHEKCGVKSDIQSVDRALKKIADSASLTSGS